MTNHSLLCIDLLASSMHIYIYIYIMILCIASTLATLVVVPNIRDGRRTSQNLLEIVGARATDSHSSQAIMKLIMKQRTKSKEQRAKSKEQRAKSKGQD